MTRDPLFDFTGKVALVTGGSRGLGYEMVKAFAARGADLERRMSRRTRQLGSGTQKAATLPLLHHRS